MLRAAAPPPRSSASRLAVDGRGPPACGRSPRRRYRCHSLSANTRHSACVQHSHGNSRSAIANSRAVPRFSAADVAKRRSRLAPCPPVGLRQSHGPSSRLVRNLLRNAGGQRSRHVPGHARNRGFRNGAQTSWLGSRSIRRRRPRSRPQCQGPSNPIPATARTSAARFRRLLPDR